VVCLAPRALGEIVGPRRMFRRARRALRASFEPSAAWGVGRPLNLLEGHLGEISAAKSSELAASFDSVVNSRQQTRSSCRRLRSAQPACACGAGGFAWKSGRAPEYAPVRPRWDLALGPLRLPLGRA